MPLRLVYGRAGTGKSAYLLDEIAALHQAGERSILLVPEQYSHMAERSIIERIGYLCEQTQALSFQRMANHALKTDRTPRLDASGRCMLINRVLFQNRTKLTYYRRMENKPGFVQSIAALFTELQKAEATPDALQQQANQAQGLLQTKLLDLSLLYEAYCTQLADRFLDANDTLTLLAPHISEQKLYIGTHIYLDEFHQFTRQELTCIEALLQNGCQVTAALCTDTLADTEDSIFAPVITTANRLTACLAASGDRPEPPMHLEVPHRFTKELAHLEQALYRYPTQPYSGEVKTIQLFQASNPYQETVWLAAEINRQIRETGICYRDIAVIAGDFELYQGFIKTVFPAYGIPVFTDQKLNLLNHPILMMLMSALDSVIHGFRTTDVLAWLKSGYAGLSPAEVDKLENFVLERAIDGKAWLEDERFLLNAANVLDSISETDSPDIRTVLDSKNRALAPLVQLKENMGKSRTVESRARALVTFLEEIHLMTTIQAQIADFHASGELQLAEQYATVYNTLIEVLDQLVACLGEDAIGLEQLQAILSSGFSERQIGVIPPSLDEVFFGDMQRSKVKNAAVVFLIGANEGTFPPRLTSTGLLSDEERTLLLENGLDIAPSVRRRTLDSRFDVYRTVTAGRGRLFVSHPIADMEGKGLRPSSLINRLQMLFPTIPADSNILQQYPAARHVVGSADSAYRYVLPQLSLPTTDYRTVYELLNSLEEYHPRLKRAKQYRSSRNDIGSLSSQRAAALYGQHLHGSVSRFETYTACPFSYFVQYGLKAKARKQLKLNTPDIGWLLHNVVDTFSRQLMADGISFHEVTDEQCQTRINAIIDSMSAVMFLKKIYAPRKFETLMRRLKKLTARSVWALCAHVRAGEFEPCGFEFTFDKNGDIPPVTIDLPTGESVTLTGRIDRIDRYTVGDTAYLRVIDYKSGYKQFSLSDIYNKLSLQLAVYIDAVWENGAGRLGKEVQPAGMFYFRLTDPLMKTNGVPDQETCRQELLKQFKLSGMALSQPAVLEAMDREQSGDIIPVRIKKDGTLSKTSSVATMEQFQTLKSYIRRTVAQIGQEILAGNIRLSPCSNGSSTACDYCEFSSICRFDPRETRYRAVPAMKTEEVWQQMELEEATK